MKFTLTSLTVALTAALSWQSSTEGTKSPKDVLEQFIRMDADGARLTRDGWYRTSRFFVRPVLPPPHKSVLVVSDTFEVEVYEMKEDRAKVNVFFLNFYGRLDPQLNLEPAPKREPNGALVKEGMLFPYNLIRTDKHFEFEPGADAPKEVSGSVEWRIEDPRAIPAVSLATAIRYVTEMRDKSTDPAIKKNAAQTVAKLKKLH